MGATLLERGLRHDRALVAAGLLLVVLLSWLYLFTGAGTMQDMDGMLMPMSAGPWTPAYALLMLLMWSVMMAAMMLPSAAPMILLYARIAAGRQGSGPAALTGVFALGYLAIWTVFSLAAVALQYALQRLALLSPMMETSSVVLAGVLLVAAGIYQWLPIKQACLRHCRSPLDFVLAHWRTGMAGAFRMGVQHGMLCLGCCWALMLLLFVGGVMNLAWIAGLALLVLAEKLAPAGHWIGRAAGVLLAGWGVATLLHAHQAG
jgi:predicted metal-binding membrane protein